MVFLLLYVDDILLIGNNVKVLSDVRVWLSKQFDMKDLGSRLLGIARKGCYAYPKLHI